MQVFKLYFKILSRGLIFMLFMYVVIFGALTIMFTNFSENPTAQVFNVKKCHVAVVDRDNSELSAGLTEYIRENSKYVNIKDTSTEGLKDALFFRKAEYIIIIPEGFGGRFFTDNKLFLKTMQVPDSASGMLLDTMTNKYLNTLSMYVNTKTNIDTAMQKTAEALKAEVSIVMEHEEKGKSMPSFLYYFNYLAYPLIAIMTMCVSAIMIIINKIDVKRRNICSPITLSSFNTQLFAANIIMAFGVFMIFFIFGAVLYMENIFSTAGLIVTVNAVIFTAVCLSLCFLIANVAKERSVSAISNVVALGGSFLGGVFVPQQLLSEAVKNVAVINPVFWYVKANNALGSLNTFSYETLKPVIFAMTVEICFAAVFFAISLVIIKQKRTQEQ